MSYVSVITKNNKFFEFLSLLYQNLPLKQINEFDNFIYDEDCVALFWDYSSCGEELSRLDKQLQKPIILFSSLLNDFENYFHLHNNLLKIFPHKNTDSFKDLYKINKETYFSIEKHSIITKDQSYQLTNLEFRLLYYLLKSAGKPLSADYLMDKLELMTSTSLYVCIKKLRMKIEVRSDEPTLLLYSRNKGYYLNIK